MLKKTLVMNALLMLAFDSVSAYTVKQNLTIINDTEYPLYFSSTDQRIPPRYIKMGEAVNIPTDNADTSYGLGKVASAEFSISDAASGVDYLRGRLAFYVSGWYGWGYSFLDSVIAGEGVDYQQEYSCSKKQYAAVFENGIIIHGKPENAAPSVQYTKSIQCNGIRSASLKTKKWPYPSVDYDGEYTVACYDKPTTTFRRIVSPPQLEYLRNCDKFCVGESYIKWVSEVGGIYRIKYPDLSLDKLNQDLGYYYCGSWGK